MTDKRFSDYNEIVSSVDELRETLGEPLPAAVIKVIDHLDDVCRSYIDKSTFIVIASSSSGGEPDISPKGDPQGFVKVIDDKHLAIPDRPGNRRLDTFQNLLDNPQIAVIFLIPGKGETLRIKGEARIVRDLSLRETMAVNGRVPDFSCSRGGRGSLQGTARSGRSNQALLNSVRRRPDESRIAGPSERAFHCVPAMLASSEYRKSEVKQ